MSQNKKVMQHIVFWGVLLAAATAEGWMDLLCRAIYSV